jgi:hypothetical protein
MFTLKSIIVKLSIASILSINAYALSENNKEYVIVNGESINTKTIKDMSGYNQQQFESMPKKQQKILLDRIIDTILLRQEAVKEVSDTPEYKALLKDGKEKLVIKLWLDKLKRDANVKIYNFNTENPTN